MTVQTSLKEEASLSPAQVRAAAKKEAAKHLYPSRARLLRHVGATLLRVPTVCTLLTFLIHPLLIPVYNTWVDYTGVENSTYFLVTLGLALHSFIVGCHFLFFGICAQFGFLQQYKIDRTKRMMPSPGLRKKAVIHSVVLHCFTRIVLAYALATFIPYPPIDEPLESPFMVWVFWVWTVLSGDVFIFYYHKAQHEVKFMYSLHKIHHEFHASEILTTEYGDMTETLFYIFLNYVTTAHKPMVMHVVIILWKMNESCETHSGYSFRGTWLSKMGFLNAYRTEFHDYHHSHNLGTYGLNLFMDFWKGTCDDFLLYQEKRGKSILD